MLCPMQGLYTPDSSVLALYSCGQTNGLVVDSGLHVTSAVPVFEGYPLARHVMKSHIAGDCLDRFMHTQLLDRGFSFTTPKELDMVREIKELKGFVCEDYEETLEAAGNVQDGQKVFQANYVLPDGTEVELAEERFRTPELLFNPKLWKESSENVLDKDGVTVFSALGMHELAFEAIQNVDAEVRNEMYNRIVLSGGTSMFQGLPGRLYQELLGLYRQKFPNEVAVSTNVLHSPDAVYATWLGGSIFGTLPMLPSMLVTKAMYHEHGPSILHTMCF